MNNEVGQLLHYTVQQLAAHSPTPQLDAAVLLSYVLHTNRAGLLAHRERMLNPNQIARFQELVQRRANLEPVAYLVGEREFYGLAFWVDARVLVPRPDTELLVERALHWIVAQQRPLVIADVGTGSGCIAVALAVHAPHCRVYALDISPGALAVARRNVERHNVSERVALLESDGMSALAEPVDLVVSNPPYTLLDEIDEGVHRHEPHLALDGGSDGLAVYRRVIPAAAAILRPDVPTALLLEIGAWQAAAVVQLAQAAFPHAHINVHRDLADRDRVVEVARGKDEG